MPGGFSFLLSILVLLCVRAAEARPVDPEIRVRLKKRAESLEITGIDLRISPPSAFIQNEPTLGFHRAKISRRSSGTWIVKWDHLTRSLKIPSERLWVRGQLIRVGLEPAPYDLEILKNPARGIAVIARLDLDSYLQGVLPAEMPVSWPLEALKAQAVSARSFVLRQAFERRKKDFDVDSTVFDQVYKFVEETHTHPEWKEKLRLAVTETRGEVLVDGKKHILKAYYSADCGCQSEDPKFVWGKSEALASVKDPTCASRRPTRWSFNLNRAEVRSKLLVALNLPPEATLLALNIGGRTPSGRVAKVIAAVEVDGKSNRLAINSQEFRRIFGFEKIQSTDFKIVWNADELNITGTGNGHGVGLCQTGAKTFAEGGTSYREILKTYYPQATLLNKRKI